MAHVYREMNGPFRVAGEGLCLVFVLIASGLGTMAFAQGPSPTTTTLAISSAGNTVTSVATGTVVTLTATVENGSTPVKPGLVLFCDASAAFCEDIHIVGQAQLTSAGTAVMKFRPAIGSHSYKAVFVGTKTYSTSTSDAVSLVVTGKYPTATSMTSSGSAGSYTFAATVTSSGPPALSPSGTVSFVDTSNSNTTVGSATLTPESPALQWDVPANALGSNQTAVVAADFNRDGIVDLVTLSPGVAAVSLGNADGTFTSLAPFTTPFGYIQGESEVTADFNGDGIPDFAVSCNGIYIYLGVGDGTFTLVPATLAAYYPSLAVGDINGDGIADLVFLDGIYAGPPPHLVIGLGNGDGTFNIVATTLTTGYSPYGIVVSDLNGDGIQDVVAASGLSGQVGSEITIFLGNGDGTFSATHFPVSGEGVYAIAVGDFNGDGVSDLALRGAGDISVLIGAGDGSFTVGTSVRPSSGGSLFFSLVVADFNDDGIPDLATVFGNDVDVFLGDGTGNFFVSPAFTPPTAGSILGLYQIAVGNFTGDGSPGLAIVGSNYDAQILDLNFQLSATASSSASLPLGTGTHQIRADYGGDTNFSSSSSSLVPVSAHIPTLLALTVAPGTFTAGQPLTMTATLSPYTQAGYTTNGETITFYNGTNVLGTGVLANGVATFTIAQLLFSTSSTYSLTAKYGGDASFAAANSNPVLVSPQPVPSSLTLAINPSTTTVGQTVVLTATFSPFAQGSFSTNGETITFSSGSLTIGTSALNNGVATLTLPSATFPVSLGSYSLRAAKVQDDLFGPVTSPIEPLNVVRYQPALTLTTSSASIVQGQNLTFTVGLTDYYAPSVEGESIGFYRVGNAGNVLVGTATISSGIATLTTSSLPVGAETFIATYSGDANDVAENSNTVLVGIAPAGQAATATSIAVTSAGSPVATVPSGTAVTLTATVKTSGTPATPGTVVFCDGSQEFSCNMLERLGAAQLTSSGTASITTRLAIGSHTIIALFFGGGKNGPSASSPSTLTVTGKYATTTSIVRGNGANVQATLPYRANLDVTGAVQFIDQSNGNASLGTFTLASQLGYRYAVFHALSPTLKTGGNPYPIVAGDFNGDGIPDIAVANSSDKTVGIFLGKGDGSFQPQATYAAGSGVFALATGDFNNDGKLDLAATNFSDNRVSILLGMGDGTFQPQVTYATDGGPDAIAVADFDGDGILDLAITNQTANTVSILLGNVDGTFQAQVTYATGSGPDAVAVGDFRADGLSDLAIANNSDGTVSILLGNGNGTFQPQVTYQVGNGPVAIAQADFNSDNYLDLAVVNVNDNTLSVLTGKGDGTFPVVNTYKTGSTPQAVVAGSFAGRGLIDLAVVNAGDSTISVFENDSGLREDAPITVGSGPIAIASADWNGDGMSDLAVLNNTDATSTVILNNSGPVSTTGAVAIIPPGLHEIVATYGGSGTMLASTSPRIIIRGNSVSTTLALGTSLNPSNYGDAVTLTATVTPASVADVSTDGGSVTFLNGGSAIGTGLLSSSTAKLTIGTLPAGANRLTASFGGINGFNGSTSQVLSQVVRPAPLTATGPNVTRTFGTANPDLTGSVTGAVNGDSFIVTGTTTATVASSVGTYPIVPTATGARLTSYTVAVVDGTLTVTQAKPAASLIASANPASTGNVVTFTATVSSPVGTPSGTVSFYDGSSLLGTGTLSSGSALLSTSNLSEGTHAVTAVYSGDTNFAAVTSSPVNETIASFAMTPATGGSSSATVSPGGQALYKLLITPSGGTVLASAVSLALSGLPPGATGTFSPASVPAGSGPATVTLTVSIPSSSALLRPAGSPFGAQGLAFSLALILLPVAGLARKTARQRMLLIVGMTVGSAACLVGLNSCGAGSPKGSGGGGGSTPQSYTLTVTAISGSISQKTNLTLTVE